MTEKADLLADIASYCRAAGISESAFGRHAVNNHKLVGRIRDDLCTVRTLIRVRAFLDAATAAERNRHPTDKSLPQPGDQRYG